VRAVPAVCIADYVLLVAPLPVRAHRDNRARLFLSELLQAADCFSTVAIITNPDTTTFFVQDDGCQALKLFHYFVDSWFGLC
jgi:hypothetical protein